MPFKSHKELVHTIQTLSNMLDQAIATIARTLPVENPVSGFEELNLEAVAAALGEMRDALPDCFPECRHADRVLTEDECAYETDLTEVQVMTYGSGAPLGVVVIDWEKYIRYAEWPQGIVWACDLDLDRTLNIEEDRKVYLVAVEGGA